jgi:hypothetical protein
MAVYFPHMVIFWMLNWPGTGPYWRDLDRPGHTSSGPEKENEKSDAFFSWPALDMGWKSQPEPARRLARRGD